MRILPDGKTTAGYCNLGTIAHNWGVVSCHMYKRREAQYLLLRLWAAFITKRAYVRVRKIFQCNDAQCPQKVCQHKMLEKEKDYARAHRHKRQNPKVYIILEELWLSFLPQSFFFVARNLKKCRQSERWWRRRELPLNHRAVPLVLFWHVWLIMLARNAWPLKETLKQTSICSCWPTS